MHAVSVVAIGGDDVSTGICTPDVNGVVITAGGDVWVIGRPGDGIDISEVAIIGTEEGSYGYRCRCWCRSGRFGGSLDGMREMRHPGYSRPCGSSGYQPCKTQQ